MEERIDVVCIYPPRKGCDVSLQVLGEILILTGFFAFSKKKIDKLIFVSYAMDNEY